jgi:hypothetical protein
MRSSCYLATKTINSLGPLGMQAGSGVMRYYYSYTIYMQICICGALNIVHSTSTVSVCRSVGADCLPASHCGPFSHFTQYSVSLTVNTLHL